MKTIFDENQYLAGSWGVPNCHFCQNWPILVKNLEKYICFDFESSKILNKRINMNHLTYINCQNDKKVHIYGYLGEKAILSNIGTDLSNGFRCAKISPISQIVSRIFK